MEAIQANTLLRTRTAALEARRAAMRAEEGEREDEFTAVRQRLDETIAELEDSEVFRGDLERALEDMEEDMQCQIMSARRGEARAVLLFRAQIPAWEGDDPAHSSDETDDRDINRAGSMRRRHKIRDIQHQDVSLEVLRQRLQRPHGNSRWALLRDTGDRVRAYCSKPPPWE